MNNDEIKKIEDSLATGIREAISRLDWSILIQWNPLQLRDDINGALMGLEH